MERNYYNFDYSRCKWVKYEENLDEKVNWSYFYRPYKSDIEFWQRCKLKNVEESIRSMIEKEKRHLGIDHSDALYEKLVFNICRDLVSAAEKMVPNRKKTIIHVDEDDGYCD